MTFELPDFFTLVNESDVEQKLVYPLLVADPPFGFGIPANEILTKLNIKRLTIGKGSDKKSYFPDYLLLIGGIPLAVIEAKAPGEDVDNAFREARLYAAEVNAIFRSGANPLMKVLATNGERWLAGSWDHDKPAIDMSFAELSPSSVKMGQLHELLDNTSLSRDYAKVSAAVKPSHMYKPRRMIGGLAIQEEEIGHNTFGATISAEFANIFNPASIEDRIRIAKEGYIASRRRQRYVDPIDKVIRASRPPSEQASKPFEDTSDPRELLKEFKEDKRKQLEHQVLLIVGGVGVGKTTFIDHLQYSALPKEVIDSTVWIRVNMNNAPISADEIYNWFRLQIVLGCRDAYPKIDFDELDTIKALFSVEVHKFEKGVGALHKHDQNLYNLKLADRLTELLDDLHQQAVAYTRYCATERAKLPVIVVDNCDKRTLDHQLLMFEVAQWTQREFRALVILPLREETYDNYRDKPPLDTALKDLVFRIEPPSFQHVLISRVQMALNDLKKRGSTTFHYDLPNGFRVEYPQSDKAYYLTTIVQAIFEHDHHLRRLILGLSGRNIRRALEMFLEICTSGHITEDVIFRIRQAEGKLALPLRFVERVLLRMNRRFYDSDKSYIKNLLAADAKDANPSHFTRLLILRWLFSRFNQQDAAGLKGYFSVKSLIDELALFGIEPSILRREVGYLTRAHCITTEDFNDEVTSDEVLIRLAPAGFVHLDLMSSVTYLASVAEDTYFYDEQSAQKVADNIRNLQTHYDSDIAVSNARAVTDFLQGERAKALTAVGAVVDSTSYEKLSDLSMSINGINGLERALTTRPWTAAAVRYKPKGQFVGRVVNAKNFGVFVELEPGISGLIPAQRLPLGFIRMEQFIPNERLIVEIQSLNPIKRRIDLSYVGEVPEEQTVDDDQMDLALPIDESDALSSDDGGE
ncbi:MAG: S1 RNA-binding domain-containing protein [Acidobacteria bacterium]|nr:S1 RNA-binding domain-containing protein [Acidobacteriota bacterium]